MILLKKESTNFLVVQKRYFMIEGKYDLFISTNQFSFKRNENFLIWRMADTSSSDYFEFEKLLRSGVIGEQCEGIVQSARLLKQPETSPVLLNSLVLKLADLFRIR